MTLLRPDEKKHLTLPLQVFWKECIKHDNFNHFFS
jgi:hypothetical protein